jgi:pimeloyl-ACP methyl ester carboxylesterase
VPVDTLQNLSLRPPPIYYKNQAAAFRKDFTGTIKQMVRALFHPNTYPEIFARVEKRTLDNSPEMAAALMESFAEFDFIGMVKGLNIPIRCINGDLFPTQVKANQEVYPDYDAVILPNTGHFPMLENPALFNRHLEDILKKLKKK